NNQTYQITAQDIEKGIVNIRFASIHIEISHEDEFKPATIELDYIAKASSPLRGYGESILTEREVLQEENITFGQDRKLQLTFTNNNISVTNPVYLTPAQLYLFTQAITFLNNLVFQGTTISPDLYNWLTTILNSPDNRAPPVYIVFSDNLSLEAARYYDDKENVVYIIFSKSFIEKITGLYNQNESNQTYIEALAIVLAKRLFHELGHKNNVDSPYEQSEEEYELTKKDILLHKYISALSQKQIIGKIEKDELQSAYYEAINSLAGAGKLIDQLISEIDTLKEKVKELERIRKIAYKKGFYFVLRSLPEEGFNLTKELPPFYSDDPKIQNRALCILHTQYPLSQNCFIYYYLQELGARALHLNFTNPYSVFRNNRVEHIEYSEVLGRSVGASQRHYSTNHLGIGADSLQLGEAENPPASTQTLHNHFELEMTTAGGGRTILINGEKLEEVLEELREQQHNPLSQEKQIVLKELKEYEDLLKGRRKGQLQLSDDTFDYLKQRGVEIEISVGSTTYVPYGYIHTIRNGSTDTSSWDFTFKGCNLIMYKFPTPTSKGEGQIGSKSPDYTLKIGNVTIYIHKQNHTINRPLYNNVEMYFTSKQIDINNQTLNIRIPKENEPEELHTLFISIPKGSSIKLPCMPLTDDIQLIRLMPWPTNIGSNWNFKDYRGKIKAEVTVYDDNNQKISTINLSGGENIFLNNSDKLSDDKVGSYEITNTSEEDFEIAIVTIVSADGIEDIEENISKVVLLDEDQEIEIYGKDFNILSRYFGGDIEKLIEQLKSWQKEFKEKLNKEVSLLELTTFKDDQHPNGTEYFLVTDENGNYSKDENGNSIRPRDLCHKDGTWHRSVFVLLVDKEGRILVQIRSDNKKFFPGCRDTSASGHLGLTEEYLEGAIRETEEEVFDSQIKLDRSRIVQISKDSELTVIHNYPEKQLNDRERSSLFVYFVNDEEKSKIKKQESEVKGLEWISLQEEIKKWQEWVENQKEAKEKGVDYAALGIDILKNENILQQIQIVIANYLLKQLEDNLQGVSASQIILVMDKDKTVTEPNERISLEMLEKIITLLNMGVEVVIITGGILEHSLSTLIEPIEDALKNRGMSDKLVNFHYYYMSGSGWIHYDKQGNRQMGVSNEEITEADQKEIIREMAISFLEEAGDLFKLDVRSIC
ncbi:MAG: NUDIX domain-containing protein, partial [Candidatus Omnitrophica bacterium]|nr:NUDIX domain-containing protein [Candidatus Omnitrophota bacterium]